MSKKPVSTPTLIKYLNRHPHLELEHPGGTSAVPKPGIFPRRFLKYQNKTMVFITPSMNESDLHVGPETEFKFFPDRFEASIFKTKLNSATREHYRDPDKPPMSVLVYHYREDGPIRLERKDAEEPQAALEEEHVTVNA